MKLHVTPNCTLYQKVITDQFAKPSVSAVSPSTDQNHEFTRLCKWIPLLIKEEEILAEKVPCLTRTTTTKYNTMNERHVFPFFSIKSFKFCS